MISNIDQRVLFWDDSASSFLDITREVNAYNDVSASLNFDVGDKLYIGSYFPINHKYLNISSANAIAADVSVEYYGSRKWNPVVDILDYTELASVPLARPGILQFTPDRDEGWNLVTDTSDEPYLTEFSSGPVVYDKYWTRLGFSAAIGSVSIAYVGSLLAEEDELLREYPHLNQAVLLRSWEVGKTDWLEQRIIGSEYVLQDLVRKSVIVDRSQILDIAPLGEACIHKTAEIIMTGLGVKNYKASIEQASKRYSESINIRKFDVDANANGQKERFEKRLTTNRVSR